MRHGEERRTYVDVDMGPVIQKNMNRCIHCTRCIRFGEEVAGIHEMVAIKRGNNIDITTIDGKQLKTEYAGNYSDICPTGSLTLKDFRFKKRAWMLKKTATVCEGCSKGCNMEIQHEGNTIYRCVPRENLSINKYWMCDEGRFNYQYTQDPSRILDPMKKIEGSWIRTRWETLLPELKEDLSGSRVLVLIGTDLTQEEISSIREALTAVSKSVQFASFGTPGIAGTAEDGPADKILKMKSKTSNLYGAEKAGIAPLSGAASADLVVVFRGGRAELPKLDAKRVWGVGVFLEKDRSALHAILPGLAFTEKDGTIYNHQGVEQKIRRAVLPRGDCKPVGEMLMLLLNRKTPEVGV
jgi:NADH-quinone oxidoreductase subunit G